MASPLPKRSSELENEQSGAYEAVASAQPTNQPEYEYDFVEQPSQDFYCPVSFELLRDPQQTTCCGNHLSQKAAERLQREGKPCPMCKELNLSTMPDKFYMRKVNELLVRCPHECKWVGPLSDFDQHCNSCPKRPWVCEYCHFRATYEVGVNNHLPNCTKYPEPCPNHCDIGTVERCNLENHLQECPLRLVECVFREFGCSVRVPHRDMGRHMEESGQQHLLAMSLLNRHLIREFQHNMEEKDRQIMELREQLKQQGRQLQEQEDKTTQEVKQQMMGLHQQGREIQKQLLQQKWQMWPSAFQLFTFVWISVLLILVLLVSEIQRQRVQKIDHALPTLWPNYFDFTLTEFSSKKDSNFYWHSNPFYTHPQGYKLTLNIETNGNGNAKGTHVSAYLKLEKGEFDDELHWPIRCTGQLLLLNQLGNHGHHAATILLEFKKGNAYKTISWKFITHLELIYNDAKNTQYLMNDCLHFRLYLNVT